MEKIARDLVQAQKRNSYPEYMCDIFDPDGRFISRVGVGNYAKWPHIPMGQLIVVTIRNRLYCIRQKESGYKELAVLKMKWE
jgi:hypothetical protein